MSPKMIDRRRWLALTLSAPAAWAAARGSAQTQTVIDSGPLLQREIDAATKLGRVCAIPSGISYVSRLHLPANARLVGAGRASRLVAIGSGPMLSVERSDSIALENITFDGAARAPGGENGLIEAQEVADLRILDCALERVSGHGVKLARCGGRIERTTFRGLAESAVFCMDGAGLSLIDNHVEECGNNGILIWRGAKGDDGAIIRGNRLSHIRADRGGDGPYGNAVNVFRAGGVVCDGNVIRNCAFSAIRYNAGSDAGIVGNNCGDLGEVAIYVEFGFEGAVVQGNLVDGASVGISITNFDQGGRLAACTGNVMRNLDRPRPQGVDLSGIGIHVEADTVVSGNAVDRADGPGLQLGYGTGLRNVLATGNILNDCGFGVAVSVAPGAGSATVSNNTIARSRRGAIVGMAWDKIAAADLVAQAASYPQLSIVGNQLR
jgi:uncharacterized secreted repeat protein (TIGR03808 family)